jgi:predicted GH43/DUF377 family glycosyl hydrolase
VLVFYRGADAGKKYRQELATVNAAELEGKLRTMSPDPVLKHTVIDLHVFLPQSDS